MAGKDSSPGKHKTFECMKLPKDLKLSISQSAFWNFG